MPKTLKKESKRKSSSKTAKTKVSKQLSKDKEILKEMYDTVSKEFDENPNYDDDTIDGVPIGNRPHPEMKEVI